jgi:hypothetical protein
LTFANLENTLLGYYGIEGMPMPYTWEDFERETTEEFLKKLTPEQRMEGLPPEALLAHLTVEQRLRGLSLQQFEEYLKQRKAAEGKTAPQQPENGTSP